MAESLRLLNMSLVYLGNIILVMTLFEYKYSTKNTFIILGLTWLVVTPIFNAVYLLLGEEVFFKLFMLLLGLPLWAVLYFITEQSLAKTLFNIFWESNLFFIIMFVSGHLSVIFFRGSIVARIVFNIILYVICIVCSIRFFRKPYLAMLNKLHKGFFSLLLVSILFTVMFSVLVYDVTMGYSLARVLYRLTVVVVISVYVVIFTTLRYMLSDLEHEEQKARESLLLSQLDAQRNLIEVTKIHHHDLRHHNLVMLEYLSKNDTDGAKAYLKEYEQYIETDEATEYCKNPLANAVLSLYAAKSKKEQINFNIAADIPADIPIANTDLSTIFSNILENAFEASIKAESDRLISLTAITENNQLKINLKNTLANTPKFENGLPLTTKPKGGGTGLSSVRYAVSKYGGMVHLKADEHEFITQIIIGLKSTGK